MNSGLLAKLRRMYPSCTRRELDGLAASLEGNKYWRVSVGYSYGVALTRARSVMDGRNVAEVTGVGLVTFPEAFRQYCRRGRVVLVSYQEPFQSALLVLGWPSFLWSMRKGVSERVLEGAISGKLTGYVTLRRLKEYLRSV